jgi:hypothetical protein
MPNTALLRRTMSLVESATFRGEWNQGHYRVPRDGGGCGTALCFAGWAVIAAGAEFASDDPSSWLYGYVRDDLGGVWEIAAWAAHALGLPVFAAGELFCAQNTLQDLRDIVEYHCNDATEAVA